MPQRILRLTAFLLSLALSLPPSAYALRVQEPETDKHKAGLEAAIRASVPAAAGAEQRGLTFGHPKIWKDEEKRTRETLVEGPASAVAFLESRRDQYGATTPELFSPEVVNPKIEHIRRMWEGIQADMAEKPGPMSVKDLKVIDPALQQQRFGRIVWPKKLTRLSWKDIPYNSAQGFIFSEVAWATGFYDAPDNPLTDFYKAKRDREQEGALITKEGAALLPGFIQFVLKKTPFEALEFQSPETKRKIFRRALLLITKGNALDPNVLQKLKVDVEAVRKTLDDEQPLIVNDLDRLVEAMADESIREVILFPDNMGVEMAGTLILTAVFLQMYPQRTMTWSVKDAPYLKVDLTRRDVKGWKTSVPDVDGRSWITRLREGKYNPDNDHDTRLLTELLWKERGESGRFGLLVHPWTASGLIGKEIPKDLAERIGGPDRLLIADGEWLNERFANGIVYRIGTPYKTAWGYLASLGIPRFALLRMIKDKFVVVIPPKILPRGFKVVEGGTQGMVSFADFAAGAEQRRGETVGSPWVPELQRKVVVMKGIQPPSDPTTQVFMRFIEEHPEYFRGNQALELGLGSGVLTIKLARAGAGVVAVDILRDAVGTARENVKGETEEVQRRITLGQSDLYRDLSWITGEKDPTFDVVIFNNPIAEGEPYPDFIHTHAGYAGKDFRINRRALEGLPLVLRPGGSAYVGAFQNANWNRDLWSRSHLEQWKPRGWTVELADPGVQYENGSRYGIFRLSRPAAGTEEKLLLELLDRYQGSAQGRTGGELERVDLKHQLLFRSNSREVVRLLNDWLAAGKIDRYPPEIGMPLAILLLEMSALNNKDVSLLRRAWDATLLLPKTEETRSLINRIDAAVKEIWEAARSSERITAEMEESWVVIGPSVAGRFAGLEELAARPESRLLVDQGDGTILDLIRRSHRTDVAVAYYGDLEEAQQFKARAAGALIPVRLHTPTQPHFMAGLEGVLLAAGLPHDIISSGLDALAAGTEELGTAA